MSLAMKKFDFEDQVEGFEFDGVLLVTLIWKSQQPPSSPGYSYRSSSPFHVVQAIRGRTQPRTKVSEWYEARVLYSIGVACPLIRFASKKRALDFSSLPSMKIVRNRANPERGLAKFVTFHSIDFVILWWYIRKRKEKEIHP